MYREAIEVVAFAVIGAIFSIFLRQPQVEQQPLLFLAALLVSLLLVPRAVIFLLNWRELGGPTYYLEFHQQGGSPSIALVSIWPTYWRKSFALRGRSFKIGHDNAGCTLQLRGRWDSNQITLKSWGVGGKQLVYFYIGFENPNRPGSYTVPDGLTDMRVDASGDGKGWFFDKLDTAHYVSKHDTNIVKLHKSNLSVLSEGELGIKLRVFGGLDDGDFDVFRSKIQAATSSEVELKKILGDLGAQEFLSLLRDAKALNTLPKTPEQEKMLGWLKERVQFSDARFSDFRVSACIITGDGEKHYGVNIENESYPAGICAESSAIAQMVSSQGKRTIAHVYLYSPNEKSQLIPCGLCLQRISSYASDDTQVTTFSGDRVTWTGKFKSLLGTNFRRNA